MFGLYSNSAQESWLSGVSSIFVTNWLDEGIFNLKFGMFRTFDSVEMRDFSDREVYSSFLPGSLILPFLFAKIFNLKASLIYFEFWACLFHFLGALTAAFISFKLSLELKLSQRKAYTFACLSSFFYIFGYLNFMQLSFGYYTDTSVYLIFLFFLCTEFIKDDRKRLWLKAVLLCIGISFEWFFITITVVSLCLELFNCKREKDFVLLSHLGPLFLMLSIYIYQLSVLDKLDYAYQRFLRRTIFKSDSNASFKASLDNLWFSFCQKHGVITVIAEIITYWTCFFSRQFKSNRIYRSLFIMAFIASFIQLFVAFQHSAVHYFSGIKLLIPLVVLLPFVLHDIARSLSKQYYNFLIVAVIIIIVIANFFGLAWVKSRWQKEHPIYADLKESFKDYGYEDLFFSYNLQILMDVYEKEDIKTNLAKKLSSFDRAEGEPFTLLATKKQIYFIESASDIFKMVNNRELKDKAKVHLVFHRSVCPHVKNNFKARLKRHNSIFVLDITKEELASRYFIDNFSCKKPMYSRSYFSFGEH